MSYPEVSRADERQKPVIDSLDYLVLPTLPCMRNMSDGIKDWVDSQEINRQPIQWNKMLVVLDAISKGEGSGLTQTQRVSFRERTGRLLGGRNIQHSIAIAACNGFFVDSEDMSWSRKGIELSDQPRDFLGSISAGKPVLSPSRSTFEELKSVFNTDITNLMLRCAYASGVLPREPVTNHTIGFRPYKRVVESGRQHGLNQERLARKRAILTGACGNIALIPEAVDTPATPLSSINEFVITAMSGKGLTNDQISRLTDQRPSTIGAILADCREGRDTIIALEQTITSLFETRIFFPVLPGLARPPALPAEKG